MLAREEERRVSIKPLKSWAVEKLPSGSKLRGLILAELESMDPQEFCSKVQTWLLLANETMSNRSLEKGSLIFLRYMDHVLFKDIDPCSIRPWTRETVGWLDYEDPDHVRIVWERFAMPDPPNESKPRATGLVILKKTILEIEKVTA